MPGRISSELAQLARLAREGGLDLSQVSLRVKVDLLLSTPHPAPDDIAAFEEMAVASIAVIDEATAVILATKLAAWRHTPATVLAALQLRGGAVLATLLRHGAPFDDAELETFAEHGAADAAAALAERPELSSAAILLLVERDERAVDLALLGNPAIALPRAAVDRLIERARTDAAYGVVLLGRKDLSHVDVAPLFLQAGAERRLAIIDSLSAIEALNGGDRRRKALDPERLAGLLDMAAADPASAFGVVATHLGAGPALAEAMAADPSRDLVALGLLASGARVEDATRFLIRLGDEAAHSVDRIFALVALMRSVRPAVAERICLQVAGDQPQQAARRGKHQPVMDPSGTPSRMGASQPESSAAMPGIMRKLGLRRDRG